MCQMLPCGAIRVRVRVRGRVRELCAKCCHALQRGGAGWGVAWGWGCRAGGGRGQRAHRAHKLKSEAHGRQ